MNNQTILSIKAKQVPSPDFLKNLLEKQKPTHFGFAIQDGEDQNNIEIALERMEGCLDIDQLVELCENAKPWPMLMAFSTLTEPHTNDDIQPFIINDPDGNATFAVTIEGDFPKFVETDSGHGETYNFFKKIIEPEIVELCELTGDLDKVLARLKADKFNTSFLSHLGHRGVLNILPIMGEPVLLGKNELGAEYDWGVVSQIHAFGEKKPEPVKAAEPVVEKKKGWFSGKKETVVSDPKGQATAGTAERTSVPAVKQAEQTVVSKKKETAMKPPSWVHKNEDIKNWYTAVHGSIPGNWKKRIPVIVYNDDAAQLTSNNDIAMFLAKKNGVVKTETAAPAPKQSQQQTQTAKTLEKHIEVATLPIIEPKKFEAVLDFVTKHLDTNSQEIANPAAIQKMEQDSKIPTFSESLGIDVHDVLNWPPAGVFALFKQHPEAGAMFAIEMRNLWRGTLDLKALVGTKKPEDKPAEAPPTPAPTEKPAEAAPAAKKGWFGKKAA